MPSNRTTARGFLAVLTLALSLTAAATAAPLVPPITSPPPPKGKSAAPARTAGSTIIFPVVGPSKYYNDFGQARGQGGHEGNDIMAPRKALAVAAEAGTVKFHSGSWAGGCMLYLNGISGTKYLYIHLNNDLGMGNDNRGGCRSGVAFPKGLKSGDRVHQGQLIGYVGDSGDANGINPHLHFEIHPSGRGAVNPFSYLNKARRLLFYAPRGATFSLKLTGRVDANVSPTDRLQVKIEDLHAWPLKSRFSKLGRTLTLAVSPFARIEHVTAPNPATPNSAGPKVRRTTIWTEEAPVTLAAQLGRPLAITASRIQLSK